MRLPALSYRLRTLYGGLALGTVLTILCLLILPGISIFHDAELTAYDLQFQHRGQRPVPLDIVVVEMDQTSIAELSKTYPVPRHFVAKAVNFLHRAGAKVIGIDFSYFSNSSYGPADDAALARALKRAGNVVVNEELETGPASTFIGQGLQLLLPIDPIARAAAGLGVDNVPTDHDNVIRRSEPLQQGFGGLHPNFPLEVAALAEHRRPMALAHSLPQELWINYVGPEAAGDRGAQSWERVQFEAVQAGEDPASLFRGKVVLIVPAAIETGDVHQTPFGDTWGGYIQANAIETILQNNPIVPAGNTVDSLAIILLGLATAAASAVFGIKRSAAVVLALFIGFPILTLIAFSGYRYWLHLVVPEVTLILVFAGVMALRFATEERQKRRVHGLFGQYVKREVVDILVDSPDAETALKGARRPVAVLFVDIRGSTAMSEHMQPEDVIRLLDVFLEELTESVEQHDGTLNKYVGDEVMAMWNAPRLQTDYAMLAVRCALDMVARMEPINRQLTARNLPNIKFGVGVNSGDAVVGQMGSSFRKQYDVVGDTINTGARLCSAAAGGEVIIGQATWELLGPRLAVEETPPLTLKGKSETLRTFKVLGVHDGAAAVLVPSGVTAGV